MKNTPEDSLRATFWGLLIAWAAGATIVQWLTEMPILSIVYLVVSGSIFLLIYQATKTEIRGETRHKKPLLRNGRDKKEE